MSDVPPEKKTGNDPTVTAGQAADQGMHVETRVIPRVERTVQVGPLDQPRAPRPPAAGRPVPPEAPTQPVQRTPARVSVSGSQPVQHGQHPTPSPAHPHADADTTHRIATHPAPATGRAHEQETQVVPAVSATPVGDTAAARTAWDDEKTRRRAADRLRPTIVAASVGAVAALACLVAAVLGVIQHSWGLWLLVGLAALAGGCLAGALAGWSIESPMRTLLKAHPWEKLSGQVGVGGQIVVVADSKRRAYDLDANRNEPVGEVGSELTVRACGGRDEKVVEFGPRKRWRLAERVAVMLPDLSEFDDEDDEDWTPSGPVGEQPGEDGLYAG
ncbi:hypothetical protein GCM10027418_11310 [Mariniluteicoccus endophyticus]